MKNVLITGCAGFIGSHATDWFVSKGYNVLGVDSLTYAGNINNLKQSASSIKFENVDIANTSKITSLCRDNQIDSIINFAAETHVDNSINDVSPFVHSNITGVISLLEVCKKLKIEMVQISTDEIYGPCLEGSFVESSPFNPKNPYAASKASSEHFITSFANTFNIDYLILRLSNNFGPRQNKEKLLPKVISNVLSKKTIPVYGNGLQKREWLFVKDAAKLIEGAYSSCNRNEVYNITKHNEKHNIDVIKMICEMMNTNSEELIGYVSDRPGHDVRYSISNQKLSHILPIDFMEYTENQFQKDIQETISFYLEESR